MNKLFRSAGMLLLIAVLVFSLAACGQRTVQPAVEKICRTYLALEGLDNRVEIEWDDISLQDITEEARADLYKAQAMKYRAEVNEGGA